MHVCLNFSWKKKKKVYFKMLSAVVVTIALSVAVQEKNVTIFTKYTI